MVACPIVLAPNLGERAIGSDGLWQYRRGELPFVTEDERAEAFLQTHSSLFFCAACLAREIGLTALQGRRLVWYFHGLSGYEMCGAECAKCSHEKRCIRYVAQVAAESITAQLRAFLVDHESIYFCDPCLALSVGCNLDEVRDVIGSVVDVEGFDRREGTCTVCSWTGVVTAKLRRRRRQESRPTAE